MPSPNCIDGTKDNNDYLQFQYSNKENNACDQSERVPILGNKSDSLSMALTHKRGIHPSVQLSKRRGAIFK